MNSFLKLAYDFFPSKKPKRILKQFSIFFLRRKTIETWSKEGNKFLLSFPEDIGWESIYFEKTFETGTTDIIPRILKPTDTVFDIGANIGWYTVLMSKIIKKGHCHSFEPVPKIFNKLKQNCIANNLSKNLTLNKLALGDGEKNIKIHTFSGLPHGHSSLSTLGRTDFKKTKAKMITLDKYIEDNEISNLDFIKIDVEGAELKVLEGAKKILKLENPPIWLFEMNEETATEFGYHPTDILEYLLERREYIFYKVINGWGSLQKMKDTSDYHSGDNVFCIPVEHNIALSILDSICL